MAAELSLEQDTVRGDTVVLDTAAPYMPTKTPTYEQVYRFGDPFSNRMSSSSLLLPDPSVVDTDIEMGDSTINYSVYEKIGEGNFRPVTNMTFEQYDAYDDQNSVKEYFQERSAGLDGESAVSGRNLIPRLYISPLFDRLFGGSYVDIQPTGLVNLDFGGTTQRVDNPTLSRRQQQSGGFNFDQQISMNLVGKIGEKLTVTANFDNNNTFDFQNNLKVEYTGYEEDIIKKIELGNVSMPSSNSLITGSQSLFGIKTELQFGKLFVTGVAARQQGESETVTVEGGSSTDDFEIQASEYDPNRHFFLGHFFRENFEDWFDIPKITSGITMSQVEVYVVNSSGSTEDTRQIVGLMDLGEGSRIYNEDNASIMPAYEDSPNDNEANSLYASVTALGRSTSSITSSLENLGLESGTDFLKISSARKLDSDEYEIHGSLGYITLLSQLSNDQMLAVSYEYSYNGQTYKVGELTEDYSSLSDNEVIFLKLLRPNEVNVDVPTWDLMMKNVYSLNASDIEEGDFTLRVYYRDDDSGIDNPSLQEGTNTEDVPLIRLLGLDVLDQNEDHNPDGNFDFVDGVTIDQDDGYVIFPTLEPLGSTLESYFESSEQSLISKYVYDELYEETQSDAEQETSKNKYYLEGEMTSSASNVISLSGIQIAENSVTVTAGGTTLTEGTDYSVNYSSGYVTILNDGVLSSGKTITVNYEKASTFSTQTKWLLGARAEYRFNDNFTLGGTILQLKGQQGNTSRYYIGSEPTSNTMYGFDINYESEVPFLTKAIDFLPLVSTKEASTLSFTGEFAQILPATTNIVNGEQAAYIDDFESSATSIDLSAWSSWKLSSTPHTDSNLFLESSTGWKPNYRRAKIAWYSVDQSVFYTTSSSTPDNITDSDLDNHYERPVEPQEIYREQDYGSYVTPLDLFEIAYFPNERGPYNYNPDVDEDGLFDNPKRNYGGITRAITSNTDFDNANIQYVQFWLLDPFIDGDDGKVLDGIFNENNTTGGELIINLGNVSEDMVPDDTHEFESGYPSDGDESEIVETDWGNAPSDAYLTGSFENSSSARKNQDIGLDGLADADEVEFFADFLNDLTLTGDPLADIEEDPSSDNYQYFLGTDWDNLDAKIVQRYKYYNGLEGNTPYKNEGNNQGSTTKPDNEDLNSDNTLADEESYYEYRIELNPGELASGEGYIVDEITSEDGAATWYQFRVPIKDPDDIYGDIDDYKTIKYIRMYLTQFSQPVVLRMSELEFVSSDWRKYDDALNDADLDEIPETTYSDFSLSYVNVEENSTGSDEKCPYVLPPGISRDTDNSSGVTTRVNEQSIQICVEDLADQDARAVYKTVDYSLVNYGKIKMFLHAETYNGDDVGDDEVTAFMRFGTDYTENYYEVEVPLKITSKNVSANDANIRREVWPEENEMNFSIDELTGVKSRRNLEDADTSYPYTVISEDSVYNFTVMGNPDISSVQVIMIGVRNPESDDGGSKSVCLWADELRVTDFDNTKGWAANSNLSLKLADVATVSLATQYSSVGFGTISQTTSERSQEESFSYDLSANVNVDKFLFPEKTGLKVPMYVSYERSIVNPKYDPLNPDITLAATLAAMDTKEERDTYRKMVQERTTERSINFTNVHKEKVNPDAKSHFYDIENFSLSYSYNEETSHDIDTEQAKDKNITGEIAYSFSPKQVVLEPFAKSKAFKSPFLELIKDLNISLLPSSVAASMNVDRSYEYYQLYNDDLTTEGVDPYYETSFTLTRNYSLDWNLFKSLSLSYDAEAYAIIDEPDDVITGEIDTDEEKAYIWSELKNLGRMKTFNQDISANYSVPLDKFPLTDWLDASVGYSASYEWVAGSQVDDSDTTTSFYGNTLSNDRQESLNGKIDMEKLYNKIKFLKAINNPKRTKKGETPNTSPGTSILRFLMSLRSVSLKYSLSQSTTLEGFKHRPYLFGMDSSWQSPGWGFLLGAQDADIRYEAAENGWLVKNSDLSDPFEQSYSATLSVSTSVEPTDDLSIQFTAQQSNNSSYEAIFRYDEDEGGFSSLTPTRSGSYSITFMSLATAFDKKGAGHSSRAFDQFRTNIYDVQSRMNSLNKNSGEYDEQSQEVMIPAFIEAYSGSTLSNSKLNPIPRIPMPAWTVEYSGLTKISALAEKFSNISLTHSYKSTYSISSYTFNSSYYGDEIGEDFDVTLDKNILDYPLATQANDTGVFVPVYTISSATITEQFSPLIGLSFRSKSNIAASLKYNKSRTLSLSISNAQISETNTQDISMSFSYSKENFKLPFRVKGRTITLENALTTNLSVTFRDTETVLRQFDGESTLTAGSANLQYRPSITYKLMQSLDLTLYFQRSVTMPKVSSSSYKTASTSFGTQLKFSLAQ